MSGSLAAIRAGGISLEAGINDAPFLARLKSMQASLQAFGSQVRMLGMQTMAFGGASIAPFAFSTSTYAGFEKSMARVDALTRGQAGSADEASANYRKLTQEAKRLGETTEYSASQSAEMMYQFAMRGYRVNEILAATGPALQMATAGNMELAEAAGIAGDIMGGMKLPATELGRVTDIMAKAFSTSATDLRQLGEAFKYAGPTASSMGFSITEVTAALQVLADAGQKGEMAGTTLRGMLETLKDPSKEAREELARLGVVLDDGHGRFRDLASIIGDMESGLSKLSQVEAAQAISRIFTNRQTTGTTILVTPDDTGVGAADRIREKDKALQNAQGTGAAIQARHLDTLWGAWKLIESAIEGVAITIGETLAPTIREWASTALYGIELLHNLVKENKDWIPTIVTTGVAVIGLGAALVVAGTAATVLGVAITGLGTVAGIIGGVIGAAFSPVILGIAAGVGLIIALASELGATWEGMLPVLKAVAGFTLAWVAVSVGAVMMVIEIVKVVIAEIARAVKIIGDWLSRTFPDAMKGIGNVFSSLVARFSNFFDGLAETFNKTWGGIVAAVSAGDFALAGEVAMAGFKVAWQQGVQFLTGLWRDFLWLFVGSWHASIRDMNHKFNSIWFTLEKAWFESFAFIAKGWGNITDTMLKAFNTVLSKMTGSWTAFKNWISGTEGGLAAGALKEGLDFRVSLDSINDAIDKARAEAERKTDQERKALEAKRVEAEQKVNEGYGTAEKAYKDETARQLAESNSELVKAQKELADALRKAELAVLVRPMVAGVLEAAKVAREDILTPKDVAARAQRAMGGAAGPSAVGEAAGTFDAAVIGRLGSTTGDSVAKQQLRIAEEHLKELRKLIDIARESGNTFA